MKITKVEWENCPKELHISDGDLDIFLEETGNDKFGNVEITVEGYGGYGGYGGCGDHTVRTYWDKETREKVIEFLKEMRDLP